MDLAKEAKRQGHPALALTDHGNLYGAIEFYKACKEVGIKPIIGLEAYISPGHRTTRDYNRVKGERMPYGHITLLAKNNVGYKNLLQLSTKSYTEGFYYKPRIDLELLEEHKDGLICLSGCMSSYLARSIMDNKPDTRCRLFSTYKRLFGDDFCLEHIDTGVEEQQDISTVYNTIGATSKTKCVATNDVHMLSPDDIEAHQVLLSIGNGKPLDKIRDDYVHGNTHFRTREEMEELFPKEYLDITLEIADKCNVTIELGQQHNIGKPREAFNKIKEICDERIHKMPTEYKERYSVEIQAIRKTGYSSYIHGVADFINFAKKAGIPIGSGRGSSAGSLVCWLLGITEIDPIQHGLLFERFINVDRVEPPDIDVDICQARRGELIVYLKQKYGADRVAQITTFGRLKTKAVIKDVCRVLGISFEIGNQLSKCIPEPWDGDIDDAFKVSAFRSCAAEHMHPAKFNKLHRIAKKLEGKPRHQSTHAAGVVITETPLVDMVPLCARPKSDDVLTQYDMHNISDLGLIKFDILGLRTLTVVADACKAAGIDRKAIPLDDPLVYRRLQYGRTCGVFQYEGWGYTKFIRNMQPKKFEHLIALGALYRPGTLDSGMADLFIKRMHGSTWNTKDDFLKETYGIMLYQEQVMQIAVKYAGFSMNQADNLRKAIGKKDKELMEDVLIRFEFGMRNKGYSIEEANAMIDNITTFARYGWNKAHSVSYALLSYWTAYLKFRHPLEFFCAILNSEISDQKRLEKLAAESGKEGITIAPPHVNLSEVQYTIHGTQIYAGLQSIKGIGEKSCAAIIIERSNRKFRDADEFRIRVAPKSVNSRAFQALVDNDAFRPLPAHLCELHLDIGHITPFDMFQVEGTLLEHEGDAIVYYHRNGQIEKTDIKIDKTTALINKLNKICTVVY